MQGNWSDGRDGRMQYEGKAKPKALIAALQAIGLNLEDAYGLGDTFTGKAMFGSTKLEYTLYAKRNPPELDLWFR